MRNFIPVLTLAAGLAVTMLGTSAQATPVGPVPYSVPLSSLLATYDSGGNVVTDPTFVVDNLVFHGFSYVLNSGAAPTADDVQIWRWKDANGNFGIEITGGFVDSALTAGNTDATLGYTVTSMDGATISDAHLHGDGVHTGFGSISIAETWYNGETNDFLARRSISSDYVSDGQVLDQLDEMPPVLFDPNMTSVRVVKDIQVNAGPIGSAAISVIDQTFSQIPHSGDTPEPMTLSIFGLGAVGLLFRRSRKA